MTLATVGASRLSSAAPSLAERVQRLEAIARDVGNHHLVWIDLAGEHQLLQHADGHAAGRFGEDALGPRQQPNAFDDLWILDCFECAAGLLYDLERVVAVG